LTVIQLAKKMPDFVDVELSSAYSENYTYPELTQSSLNPQINFNIIFPLIPSLQNGIIPSDFFGL
jgi:hypothetical protein